MPQDLKLAIQLAVSHTANYNSLKKKKKKKIT